MASASRKAIRAHFCNLCNKGYARADELEKHYSSYDHMHAERRKNLQQLDRSLHNQKHKRKSSGDEQLKSLPVEDQPKRNKTASSWIKKNDPKKETQEGVGGEIEPVKKAAKDSEDAVVAVPDDQQAAIASVEHDTAQDTTTTAVVDIVSNASVIDAKAESTVAPVKAKGGYDITKPTGFLPGELPDMDYDWDALPYDRENSVDLLIPERGRRYLKRKASVER